MRRASARNIHEINRRKKGKHIKDIRLAERCVECGRKIPKYHHRFCNKCHRKAYDELNNLHSEKNEK